jgi:hypothetical protein
MHRPEFYFDVLYPLQDRVLAGLRDLATDFYLAGGTAASRAYLQHRFSDDLDLFTNDSPQFRLWGERLIDMLAGAPGWRTEILTRETRFVRINVVTSDAALKIELIDDVPAHVGEIVDHPVLGRVDSAENLLANKLTALIDRAEPKDLADVWGFCCRLDLSIARALTDAHSKAAGLFPPDLARVLIGATEEDWRMIRWIRAPDLGVFLADLRRLAEELLEIG